MIFIHVFHDLILKCLYLNLFFFFSPSGPKYLVNYFPGGSDSKISACSVGDLDLISGSGRSPGEENGYPLQYSCLENSRDREAWWATVYRIAKNRHD